MGEVSPCQQNVWVHDSDYVLCCVSGAHGKGVHTCKSRRTNPLRILGIVCRRTKSCSCPGSCYQPRAFIVQSCSVAMLTGSKPQSASETPIHSYIIAKVTT